MRGRGARFLGLAGSSILIVLVAMPAFGASSNSTAGPGVGAVRWIEGKALPEFVKRVLAAVEGP